MKRLIATLLCVIMAFVLSACDAAPSEMASAPEINEFGIYMTEAEFVSALSDALGETIEDDAYEWGYIIGGDSNDTITFETEDDHIEYIVVMCSGATEDKAASVGRATDIFAAAISIIYPDIDKESLADTLKQIRYEEEQNELSPKSHFYKDVYLTYYTTFGPLGLSLEDETVTQVRWKIQSISDYNK